MSPLENQIFSRDAGKTSSLVSAYPRARERKREREREKEEGEGGREERDSNAVVL